MLADEQRPTPVACWSPLGQSCRHYARVVCWVLVCSVCMFILTRVPGPPTGVTRLGSPASPRIVPVDAAACRDCRDPRLETTPKWRGGHGTGAGLVQ